MERLQGRSLAHCICLFDLQGQIRWMRVGEGKYEETKHLIQKLLAEQET